MYPSTDDIVGLSHLIGKASEDFNVLAKSVDKSFCRRDLWWKGVCTGSTGDVVAFEKYLPFCSMVINRCPTLVLTTKILILAKMKT